MKLLLRQKYYLFILIIGLAICLPQFLYGLFWSSDFITHLKWSLLFSDELFTGDLYPRWLNNDYHGFGSPTFYYYSAVPYYFSSLFGLINFVPNIYWFPIISSASLAIILSGITCFIWLKELTNNKIIALVFSIYYMLAPYHLGIDLYARFAVAEVWSFVWIPLIMYYLGHIVNKGVLGILGFSLSYALLIFTHLPTLVIFTPIIGLYVLFQPSKLKLKISISIFIAIVVSFGIAAFYWIPALTLQEYINIEGWSKYSYDKNFLFSNPKEVQSSMFLWIYLCIITFITTIGVFSSLFTTNHGKLLFKENSKILLFWTCAFIYSLIFSTPIGSFIWKLIPFLKTIQFPWRFLIILTISSTAIFAFLSHRNEQNIMLFTKRGRVTILISVSLLLLSSILIIPIKVYQSKRQLILENKESKFLSLNKRFTPPEYLPKKFSPNNFPLIKSGLIIDKGSDLIKIDTQSSKEIKLSVVNAFDSSHVTLGKFYYPSWEAYDTDTNEDINILENKFGLLKIGIPPGVKHVTISRVPMKIEKISFLISIFSGIVLIMFHILTKPTNRLIPIKH